MCTFASMSSLRGGYRGTFPKKLPPPPAHLPRGFVGKLKSEIRASNAVLSTLSDENESPDAAWVKAQV